jgi:hypothetical protein
LYTPVTVRQSGTFFSNLEPDYTFRFRRARTGTDLVFVATCELDEEASPDIFSRSITPHAAVFYNTDSMAYGARYTSRLNPLMGIIPASPTAAADVDFVLSMRLSMGVNDDTTEEATNGPYFWTTLGATMTVYEVL